MMMKCGCDNAGAYTNGEKENPICITHNERELMNITIDLKGRLAKCSYGCKPVQSNVNLDFFKYQPEKEFDQYFCGCCGWD